MASRRCKNPLAPKPPHFEPQAKSVIFLYMYGGPSHIDTFDYKPAMKGMDNKTIAVKTFGRGGHQKPGTDRRAALELQTVRQCGKWVSDLFPNLAQHVDDIAFMHSMTADSPIHGSAMLMMNTGHILSGSPCLGSWVNYGLGTVNENLPGFVVMLDPRGGPISGAKNWSSGYMPATYQATIVPLARDRRFSILKPPRRRLRNDAAANCSTRCGSTTRNIEAHRATTPTWPRASPATNWRSRCKRPPRSRST